MSVSPFASWIFPWIPELVTTPAQGELVAAHDPAALGRALRAVADRAWNAEEIAGRSGGSWEESARALLATLEGARDEHAGAPLAAAAQ